ncbi:MULTISPECIES: excisionase [Grimontia]|uniref:Excisionase-like protein n=1 Tax=Grimontia marina TaxID=646534 RepID=A0A128EYD2_9GAMM|nr:MULTISPECIES: excisionase [Grimontia]WRV98892.1 excisionase [Grimontia sp. NTOU-MAR1]CZF79599.1 Excisionase-like protein [Grimontia marina]
MRYVTLKEWAIQTFGFAPSPSTLAAYAKTKQIQPTPVKFGGKWMCEPNARFIGLSKAQSQSISDPLVARIFKDGSSSTLS